jgi:hypothetical protein
MDPLRLRIGDDNKLYVVDGHCRRRAYIRAREEGTPITEIAFLPFKGNNVDRVLKVLHSAEGKKLAVLEVAMGYKRLSSYSMSEAEIAKRAQKTEVHVKQMLALANANIDVHKLVETGKVSATLAIEMVLKMGEKAGPYLQGLVQSATAGGKDKVTKKSAVGKAIPRKVIDSVFMTVSTLAKRMDPAQLAKVYEERNKPDGERQNVTIDPVVLAELLDAYAKVESKKIEGEEPDNM